MRKGRRLGPLVPVTVTLLALSFLIGGSAHGADVCVEENLLALYREMNAAGRHRLPALSGRQPFGRATGSQIRVAIRDNGSFLDPRSQKDWWKEYPIP